jgi:succinate dehydrogenase/fumarate reductase-like Fe-S protein
VPDYTLRIRRYDPQTDQAHHWDEHPVQMEEHNSVLEAILKIKGRARRLDRDPVLLPAGNLRLLDGACTR